MIVHLKPMRIRDAENQNLLFARIRAILKLNLNLIIAKIIDEKINDWIILRL